MRRSHWLALLSVLAAAVCLGGAVNEDTRLGLGLLCFAAGLNIGMAWVGVAADLDIEEERSKHR